MFSASHVWRIKNDFCLCRFSHTGLYLWVCVLCGVYVCMFQIYLSSSALMNHSEEFDQDSRLGKAPVVS